MYTRQQIFSLRLTTLNLTVMDIATQPQVGRQAVGSDGAARLDSLSDKPVQAGARQIWDAAQPDAANAFPILLSGHDNQGFFFRSSSTSTTPISRSRPGRTMARRNLCKIAQAVL